MAASSVKLDMAHVSWANKVKQPPKSMISSATSVKATCSSPCITRDYTHQGYKLSPTPNVSNETETDELVAKKKRKRKKKNKGSNSDLPETLKSANENVVLQDPPKIEDAAEFPDLMFSAVGSDRGSKPESKAHLNYIWGPRVTSRESSKTKGSNRKSKTPVHLDLGGMLTALEHKQHIDKTKPSSKSVVLSVGGGIPVLSREPVNVVKHPQTKQGQGPHNPLDSSAPLVKKGKQREIPKAKKPTSLKKIILKEREQRRQLQTMPPQDTAQPVVDAVLDHAEDTSDSPTKSEQPLDVPDDQTREATLAPLTFIPDGHCPETSLHTNKAQKRSDSTDTLNEPSSDLPDTSHAVVPDPQSLSNLPKIHSRRFREYCSQVLSKDVDNCVTELLKELVRFQDRMYLKDPVKAKTKRRLVMGLREVLKHLKLRKLKCIIISPNCEKIQSKGGLDDTLQTIIACACEQNVPFVFALNRKALGRCVNKAVPVSVVGIFSYDGAQDHFHKLYELTMQARQSYKDMVASLQNQQKHNEGSDVEAIEDSPWKSVAEGMNEPQTSTVEESDEPNYIKIWKRMLEEQYTPYAFSLEESVTNDMLNFHL